ncbi:hypothetical protein ACTHPH_15100 [Paenibacillus pasadenensis]|uniref:Uncharacterized protein n=1 Tax=Paenibacillus pasadenensis TaxID=217090 RepID=A0A2N5N4K2_9BACL|nr:MULTISPECIES: hypothetical protein [Paenibacillus]PLT45287.1 hypothetical protein B8V81_3718 [Paenibacillus pasadenensis]
MAKGGKISLDSKQQSLAQRSKEAENRAAAGSDENRNQKGHVPNQPSTG